VITPLLAHCRDGGSIAEEGRALWYDIRSPARVGLPAPVQLILASLT
jgi:hypothetical protein